MELVRRHRTAVFWLMVAPYVLIIYMLLFSSRASPPVDSQPSIDDGRVLIIYVWANTDVQSLGNLKFFVEHGVRAAQQADYYFILQRVNNKTVDRKTLPELPPNAHYIDHANECYDFGTFGWFLSGKYTDVSRYKYFILMNASIRGPFLVAYFDDESTWWYRIYTQRLNDEVKLVGSTINCEHKPHVQSYLLVTDQVGLKLLLDDKVGVFHCKKDYNDAVFNGEIGASQLLLHANYQIASLQVKYQGYDFRKKENWNCNNRVSPIFVDRSVDSLTHDPYELVFVKYKGEPSAFDSDLERRAHVYQKWLDEQPARQKAQKILSHN